MSYMTKMRPAAFCISTAQFLATDYFLSLLNDATVMKALAPLTPVKSSSAAAIVIDTITAGGKMDAPVTQRMLWCTLEGLVAIAQLLGGG